MSAHTSSHVETVVIRADPFGDGWGWRAGLVVAPSRWSVAPAADVILSA